MNLRDLCGKLEIALYKNDLDAAEYWHERVQATEKLEKRHMDAKTYGESVNINTTGPYSNPQIYMNQPAFRYDPPTVEPIEVTEKRRELHKKTWMYFAKLFVERYPEWDLLPDISQPLKTVIIRSKNRDLTIESTDTGIKVLAATTNVSERVAKDLMIVSPTTSYTLDNRHKFYGWALGFDDVPEFVSHP